MAKKISTTDKVLYHLARIGAEEYFLNAVVRRDRADVLDEDSIGIEVEHCLRTFSYKVCYRIRTIDGETFYWSITLPDEVVEYNKDVTFEEV